jgi:selenide,water dikinase
MQYRLQLRVPHNRVKFGVLALSADILPDHNAGVRERMERVLHARGVAVRTGSRVVGMDEHNLVLEGGEAVQADHVVWATGPAAPRWLGDSGLRTDDRGFVLVDDSLRSLSRPDVFAAGDIATMVHNPPEVKCLCVRQGPLRSTFACGRDTHLRIAISRFS